MPNPVIQLIRDMVADFIYPPGNVIAGLQGYPKHEAEQIRAGKEDGNELVQLCQAVFNDGVEAAAKMAEYHRLHIMTANEAAIRALKESAK